MQLRVVTTVGTAVAGLKMSYDATMLFVKSWL